MAREPSAAEGELCQLRPMGGNLSPGVWHLRCGGPNFHAILIFHCWLPYHPRPTHQVGIRTPFSPESLATCSSSGLEAGSISFLAAPALL